MKAYQRFQERQNLRTQSRTQSRKELIHIIDTEKVSKLLNSPVDQARIDMLNADMVPIIDMTVSPEEITDLLDSIGDKFERERLDDMLGKLSQDVLQLVAGTFGLGKLLSAWDKTGGNVTTIHNAEQGIYARTEDEYNRNDYTHTPNSQGEKFAGAGKNSVGSQFTRSQVDEHQCLQDAYTGEYVRAEMTSPDHIVSNSEFHKRGGFMMSDTAKANFSTDTRNLASTQRNINQSLSDHDKIEWMEKKQNSRENTNKEHFGIDEELIHGKHREGQKVAEEHLPSFIEKAGYYGRNSFSSGCTEGLKMGSQQAFGLLIVEFLSCVFTEIRDVCCKGMTEETLLKEISHRLKNIALQLSNKWEDLFKGFSGGFISGFISNLVTVAINMFITTGKRVVRMIREGVFSLLKALKMLMFPAPGITPQKASHEALKLLLSGGVVVGGVLLEEAVEKLIIGIPFLAPIASTVTAVIVGGLTATTMALACYIIDQADFFGSIRKDKDEFILQQINQQGHEYLSQEYLDYCEITLEGLTSA